MTEERAPVWQHDEDEISLLALASTLLRHRWLIVASVFLVTLVTILLVLPTPLTYRATASFLPQAASGGSSGLGGLAGLAGQFGISVPGAGGGESPDFYAELVKSLEIRRTLAQERFFLAEDDGLDAPVRSGTLADLLEIAVDEPDAALRQQGTVEWLDQAVTVSTGRQTGIVSLSVTTPWASLSHAVATRLLELVNTFNLQTRQSQAAAERAFIEARLAEAQDSLRTAEERLGRFLEGNRQWAGSPELTFQQDRLQRQVLMQQQVYTGLAEAYEQARISEVRNTPVITLVERPVRPARPEPRGRVMKVVLGMILGGMLGVFLAFLKAYSERARKEDDPEYAEFASEWRRTWADVRSLGGLRRRG